MQLAIKLWMDSMQNTKNREGNVVTFEIPLRLYLEASFFFPFRKLTPKKICLQEFDESEAPTTDEQRTIALRTREIRTTNRKQPEMLSRSDRRHPDTVSSERHRPPTRSSPQQGHITPKKNLRFSYFFCRGWVSHSKNAKRSASTAYNRLASNLKKSSSNCAVYRCNVTRSRSTSTSISPNCRTGTRSSSSACCRRTSTNSCL